ncbi:MAG: T9SS type A sorting domain-containing protein, partial [Bacteroidales bacterium]|nr:T9SS type A sorting domain-containing protein [Bacteroidales bacterium]
WDFSSRVYGNMKNLYFVDSNIWLASMVESFNGKVYDTLIMRTTNSGKDWQWILSSNLVNKFYFFDKENGIAVCKGGNIIKTEDSGNSWTKLVKISNANLSDIEFINESKGFVITEQGELFVTTDKGLNWKDAKLNSPYVLNDILFTDEYNGYIFGTAGCVFITRDGGNQWSNSTINKKVHFLKAFFVNNSTGYVVGTNGSIYKTNNKGISWIKMFTGINNDLTSVYFINENTGFAGGNQILLKYNESEGTIYTWENGSDISDIHSPLQSITVTDDHFYKASIIASQGCGDSEISYNIKAYKGELSVKDISKEILCGDKVVIDLKVDCPNCIDLEYEWSPATGLNGTLIKNPIINTDVSKEYRVKVTNPSACGGEQTATANVKIQIIPPVILAVKLAEDKVRLSIKGKYDSYLWSTGQTTPTITVGYGTYTAFVTAANGCSSETEPYVFNNSNPDNITNAEVNEVLLYPNPADDIIYFALPLENSKCKVEIYNLQSQKVSHFVVYQSYGNIPVSALASGLYFIHFIGENKKFVHKFYKQ